MIERHHGGGAFERVAAYCRAVKSGPLVAVSGTAATSETGAALHPGDVYAQTRVSFERALDGLAAFGGRVADVVRTRVYLTPEADWRDAVRAHRDVFEGVDPANTTLFVAGLIPEGALVEVEVDAWLGEGS